MTEKIIKRGMFKGYEIVAAETTLVEQNDQNIERLLWMIAEYKGWSDLSCVFVSDRSMLGDFSLEQEEMNALSKKLSFTVTDDDYLYEIAMRMKPVN